ncbi:hypothetical protein ABT288_13435 [Streptomyces sp. NPDC001093]|uniref:hypothetical protein n=1 Tax=Streptomyces sp. NPDC001093 TaxID=3154376 RepID=UPI00331AF29B
MTGGVPLRVAVARPGVGFDNTLGMNPASFDAYLKAHLGSILHTPADLLSRSDGTRYPDLGTAGRANNRAGYTALSGMAIVEIIPSTFEQAVAPASTWVNVVYA